MRILSLFFLMLAPAAFALPIKLDPGKGAVTFEAVGRPSALKIKGTGPGPAGTLALEGKKISGTVTFDLQALNTGISVRDKHMKEKYLETEKYPKAQLRIDELVLPSTWTATAPTVKDGSFQGLLTLHGIEKPVTGTYTTSVDGGAVRLAAHFDLKLSDYKIDIPSFAGVTVADQVTVTIDSTVAKP